MHRSVSCLCHPRSFVAKRNVTHGRLMFIRFVSGEIDDDSHVLAGLFCGINELISSYECFNPRMNAKVHRSRLAICRRLLERCEERCGSR